MNQYSQRIVMKKGDTIIIEVIGDEPIASRNRPTESSVRIIRKRCGISQERLGMLAGISASMIGAIERGYKRGSIATFKKLARVLDVSLDQLV